MAMPFSRLKLTALPTSALISEDCILPNEAVSQDFRSVMSVGQAVSVKPIFLFTDTRNFSGDEAADHSPDSRAQRFIYE